MFGFGFLTIFKVDARLLNLKKECNGGTAQKKEIKQLLSMKNIKRRHIKNPYHQAIIVFHLE